MAIVSVSCEKEVTGCTNELASNFNPYATEDCCCLIDESILRDQFLGDFYLKESCTNGYRGNYIMSIKLNSDGRVFVTNFAGLGSQFNLEGHLIGGNLEIDDNFTYDNCTYNISGSLLKKNEILHVEYTIVSPCANFELSCSARN